MATPKERRTKNAGKKATEADSFSVFLAKMKKGIEEEEEV